METLPRTVAPLLVAGALGVEVGWSEAARADDAPQGVAVEALEPDRQKVVSAIQEALNERGYDAGPADGVLAPMTRAAIVAYQADEGLPLTGEPSAPLLARLGITEVVGEALAPEDAASLVLPPEPIAETWPWRQLLVHDDFRDGDYEQDPSWTIDTGRFFVDPDHTLRSVVGVEADEDEQVPADPPDFAEVATAVLGAVLEGALGEAPVGPIGALEIAEIYLPQEINEAFAIELDLRVLQSEGGVALGPYAGERREHGYRLIYIGADQHRLELREVEGDRSRLLASHPAGELAEGAVHSVLWTLAPDGPMVVELDGREIMRVEEPAPDESFAGFTLQNFGGDYALHRIAIYGSG